MRPHGRLESLVVRLGDCLLSAGVLDQCLAAASGDDGRMGFVMELARRRMPSAPWTTTCGSWRT